MPDALTKEAAEMLLDWESNERDIQMCQLAVQGGWANVVYPRGILLECQELRPRILARLQELGITPPVSEIETLRAENAALKQQLEVVCKAADQYIWVIKEQFIGDPDSGVSEAELRGVIAEALREK